MSSPLKGSWPALVPNALFEAKFKTIKRLVGAIKERDFSGDI